MVSRANGETVQALSRLAVLGSILDCETARELNAEMAATPRISLLESIAFCEKYSASWLESIASCETIQARSRAA